MSKKENNLKATILPWVIAVIVVILFTIYCKFINYPLIVPFLIFSLGVHLWMFKKASYKLFLHLGLLLTLILFTTHVVTFYSDLSVYTIPVASIAMLTMLLFNDLQLASLMAFTASVLVSLVTGVDLGTMVVFFVGSLTGGYAVREGRTRGQLLIAFIFINLTHVICLYLLHPNLTVIMDRTFEAAVVLPFLVNGLLAVSIVAVSLNLFEKLFGVLTNYSLLELSDFNQPLLKRMILEAPGTYHHSLVVSNLAEAASNEIGANALLTRVGAYYHDIGKMVKPEYFTENQLVGGNLHDNIEPSMSRLVIINHVKEGIELAKKNKLNQAIIDFIPQHHGTSLIYFFYQKSLEEAEDGEIVHEENFRYPGPKPQTRETAITMLADSVEGATRAITDHTPTKIEETVKKIINNKFIDGQLDECPLTLKEIERISSTFTRILGAMYHGRVKYPEKKAVQGTEKKSSPRNGNQNRKSPEKTPPKDSGDQGDNQNNS